MSIDSLIKTVLGEFREIAKTETVVGKPIAVGDTVVIPVSKISFGFGVGGQATKSGKDDGGAGTGGGGSVEPVGFVVIHNGKAQLLTMKDHEVSFGKLLSLAPEVIRKLKEFREKRGKETKSEEKKDKD